MPEIEEPSDRLRTLLLGAASGEVLFAHAREKPELAPMHGLLESVGQNKATVLMRRATGEFQARHKLDPDDSFYPLIILKHFLEWELDRRRGRPTDSALLPDVAVHDLLAVFSIQAHYLGFHEAASWLAFRAAYECGRARSAPSSPRDKLVAGGRKTGRKRRSSRSRNLRRVMKVVVDLFNEGEPSHKFAGKLQERLGLSRRTANRYWSLILKALQKHESGHEP